MLAPDPKYGGLEQVTDLQARGKLASYASELLIDRDFVNYPRVTDGDFSGGGLQANFISPQRYWDADLDPRTPGFLFLHPAWGRRQVQTGGAVSVAQITLDQTGQAVVTFGGQPVTETAGTYGAFGSAVSFLDSNGTEIIGSDGVNVKQWDNFGAWKVLGGGATTAHDQIWYVNQGTSGRFVYYRITRPNAAADPGFQSLLKLDVGLGTKDIAVPLGGELFYIQDLCAYGAGIALLTYDGRGFNVWSHDGAVLQRIVRVDGYFPAGICSTLGQLFVTAYGINRWDAPILCRIGSGTFEVLSRFGLPYSQVQTLIGPPVGSGEFVYFALHNAQFNGISTRDFISVFNVLTGAVWHYGNMDGTDVMPLGSSLPQPRQLAVYGRAVIFPFFTGGNGWVQFQTHVGQATSAVYATTGWMVSSRMDFNTPGISKMFRRVIVHHAALAAGESIKVSGYVDQNPMDFTTGLTATATITNSTAGKAQTVLTFPANTQGFSMYFSLQLTAGTSQLTTPTVYYVSTEITTPWDFQFTVDCTSKRQTLSSDRSDPQGLQGKDLYYLLKNAWENGQSITLYHPTGETYICAIEAAKFFSPSPQYGTATPQHQSDFESWATLTLRQINAN